MPFPPFHLGPGLFIKGLLPNQFSFSVFALANVAMDVEPLFRWWRGDSSLHGATHTLIGAAGIGMVTAVVGRALIMRARRVYGRWHFTDDGDSFITPLQAWLGALLGTGSHLLLDAIMHADVHPFLPLTMFNPFLEISWTQNVYLACILTGMVGLLLVLIRAAVVREHA